MLDTVRLYAGQDFKVSDECQLMVKPANHIPATGETGKEFPLYRFRGQQINGQNAFLNDELVRVEINRNGLIVQTEVPKWFPEKTSNFQPVSNSEFSEFRNSLKKRLEGIGISFDFDNTKLSRVDLFVNGKMKRKPEIYFPILSRLYDAKHRMKVWDYDTEGVTFGNKQRGACFYDKRLQMEQKAKAGKDSGGFYLNVPENILRGEMRFHHAGSVQRYIGFSTLGDLGKNYGELKSVYRKQAEKMVFHINEARQTEIEFWETQERMFKMLQAENEKTGFNEWLSTEGAYNLFVQFGGFSNIEKFLKWQGKDRATVHRWMKKIKANVERKINSGSTDKDETLYQELSETFCKAVA